MLDDLKYIHEKDSFDAFGIESKLADQLRHSFTLSGKIAGKPITNIVYAAMGGSALAAQLLETWPVLPMPFQVVRDYTLPAYVGEDTLVICASYSGNTEETLSALQEAQQKGAQIACIAGGGKLKALAQEQEFLFAELPKAAQPRYAALYNFTALLQLLSHVGVLRQNDFANELAQAADFIENAVSAWLPTVPTSNNPAKQLAQDLLGQSIVVYSGPKMFPAAYKWKISFNENAKQVAWVNQLPEFNHNEFIGWSEQPVQKPYVVLDLRSSLEHPRIQKRFEVTARLLSGRRPEPVVVQAQGETVLEQMLWLVAYGDFVSLYLALLNGLNPAPVDLVEKFKQELDK